MPSGQRVHGARRADRSPVATRRLMARVRSIMAEGKSAEERLDQIAQSVASELVAEVCSIYVRKAGEVLELFATHGLKPEAVHKTRLRFGEGLVGEIAARARPFALEDAQAHPNFAYRPETGEDPYHSLMGVPIMRGGRVTGVVAVQNRTKRSYAEEEVETVQTVAMTLAELIATGELVSPEEMAPQDGIALKPLRLEGIMLNGGISIGKAVLHQPILAIETIVSDDPEHERERLREAFREMHGAIDELLESDAVKGSGEHRDVLETYRLIAADAGWLSKIEAAIASGLTAEAAVQRVQNELRGRLSQVEDPYLRERAHDLDDLGYRLIQHLLKVEPVARDLPDDAIVVTRNMGPAQLLDYDTARVRGLVLEEGSPTSHVAIIARALDIPVVGRMSGILDRIADGEDVILDGDRGQVFLRPGDDVRSTFVRSLRLLDEQRASFRALRDLPSETKDGVEISLLINAGLRVDVANLKETNADGIGLFRTEIPFMIEAQQPDVERQQEIYKAVMDGAGHRPVTFRTLDTGGDKALPYGPQFTEENPAMGWRAIRVSLDRPLVLREQLRALINAADGRALSIMFPMVAEVAEFQKCRELLDLELKRAADSGTPAPEAIRAGVMLEVPGLVFQLPQLLEEADFVSVGSNDLLQFLFAVDRGNPRLADRYDELNPSVLALMRQIAENCRTAGKDVSICGEMAGKPLEAMTLLGLGFRRLSMVPSAVGPVKAMVRSLDISELERYLETLSRSSDHSLRGKLRAFAADHGVMI